MPPILRTVRENRWYKESAQSFLAVEDAPADPLGDLITQGNRLSVFEVAEPSRLERVVRAVAVGKHSIDHTGWVMLDSALLHDCGIEIEVVAGVTKDAVVNEWHRDLVVSGNRLVALTKAIFRNGISGVVLKKRMLELVEQGIRDNELPESLKTLLSK